MKFKKIIAALRGCTFAVSICGSVSSYPFAAVSEAADTTATEKDEKLENKLFSITMPAELSGLYEVKTEENWIGIYDKQEMEDYGGYAFGIYAYQNPSDYGVMVGSKKIGEMTDGEGTRYDILLNYPTDVQYDYTKEEPQHYKKLYEAGAEVAKTVESVDGGSFGYGDGTKGEELYTDVLEKHIKAVSEGWDAQKLEDANMSSMYYAMRTGSETNVMDRVGYAYYDVNADGIDELLVGEIAEGDWKGVIYDVYTMVDRKPAHVVSGWSRSRYYVSDENFLCNEYSSGAGESGWIIYNLEPNSTELLQQVSFKVDTYENEKKPWFLSYSEDEWENVSEKKWNERKEIFDNYTRFDYTPLSGYESADTNTSSEPETNQDEAEVSIGKPKKIKWKKDDSALPDAKGLKAVWSKVEGADGYQYRISMLWPGKKTWELQDKGHTTQKSASFFFQDNGSLRIAVRTYRNSDGKKILGKWVRSKLTEKQIEKLIS